ncbi:DUF2971 domain-containing protein [Chryseobacterium nematophagum]|uniref:DUF2971 domain-containing protein n=1 Tax=Chryseobacterium nematophagum TaxID=2305228 RepID=A0A3M7LAG1_9FLAO|nr:DUF2971 domain-containing protein [Chryseobacterium nematophagum]RMZ58446.1 DUF2971 domain-containing protein [Chryseobacterium nematophagum]
MTQKYTYNNFTYELDEKFNHIVTTNPQTKEPDVIYKYYGIGENSFSALENLRLYCTHPYLFNDSMDSSELLLDFENLTIDKFKRFHQKMLPDKLDKLNLDELFEEDLKRNFYTFRGFVYNYFSRKIGLISLTTIPFNILMWSHYTNETGFLIEFDTKNLLDDIPQKNKDITNYCFRPVQYVEKLEIIKMFDENFKTPDIPFLYTTTIKLKEWEYEQEWRLSIYKEDMGIPASILYPGVIDYEGKNNRFFKYSKETIKSISLGKHFFSGRNCEKVVYEKGIVVTLFEREDEKFKDSDKKFINFVNHLNNEYNDRLYISGEYGDGGVLRRSLGRIELEKLDYKTFKIVELKDIIIKD